jgi:hypothetical protein
VLCTGVSEHDIVKRRLHVSHGTADAFDVCVVALHVFQAALQLFEHWS